MTNTRYLIPFFYVQFMMIFSFSHAFFHRIENLAPIEAVPVVCKYDDNSIINRVLTAYNLSASENENRGNSMWQFIFDERHKKIHQNFRKAFVGPKYLRRAASILRDPSSTDLFYGVDNLNKTTLPNLLSISHASVCLDGFIRFAEVIGAIRLYNPEASPPQYLWNGDGVLNKIENVLGHTLNFPNPYPREHGVLTKNGIISYRVPQVIKPGVSKSSLNQSPIPKFLKLELALEEQLTTPNNLASKIILSSICL